ncbi:uncharacterized protein LOC116144684 [Pistacia vera]|uniref:uncharacterized protein LOC116144684 n=1 Tax=Pistacia vera TaxID=55513 RepID=UPI001262E921|nr:uncharacterized protein LOC116144684 [Pistacia vera]
MTDKRIAEKVTVSLPEKFEAKISSLEDSKYLTHIILTKLVHALRLLRLEDVSEGAMLAAHKGKSVQENNKRFAGDKKGKERSTAQWNKVGGMKNFPACSHCKKKGHAENRCWIKVGNGEYVEAKGKGDVDVQTPTGMKLISNVLYAPDINQSLLSVGQMLEKDYALHFQNQSCIILDSEGSEIMRAEAVNTGVYLRNRLPTRALISQTPFEAWIGVKPVVDNLKVFKSVCYVLVPTAKRSKLEDKALTRIFIGYSSKSKAYRLYIPDSKKILVSRDVTVEEDPGDESNEEISVRGTRSLADVYYRCNVVQMEPSSYSEALNEEIYIDQPEGYQIQGEEGKVYLLKKALYGLKQALRAWYSRINDHLLSLDFVRSPNEHTLYIREVEDDVIIISLYVDDLLVIGSTHDQVEEFKKSMHSDFEMTDLGEMSYFLQMEID